MQDLQVTIEVRFITLSDNFFERIGVDFDFNIAKNIANPQAAGFTAPQNIAVGGNNYVSPLYAGNTNGTSIAGLTNAGGSPAQSGIFTPTLSIPFQQGSYALAVPQFGGFDATAGATVGFAILSDIEAYFFISAAQGDLRTNILQAPKVTLFNGQQAYISDTSQTPFVMGAVPVVGEFAAAEQPVIVVLSEGTFMTVQAVVSNDRRFVRLTIVPFFSKIGNVNTFTFSGSQSTTTNTTRNGIVDAAAGLFDQNNNQQITNQSGVTVQLPTFAFTTVTTTVSVPDGGTVLLGGIKRLSEGRNEFGVPILDKIPYLDRLFRNVGIGRETSSLMMMVTPRIIIQEEEEEKSVALLHRNRSRRAGPHCRRDDCNRSSPVWYLLPEPSPAHPPRAGDGVSWERGAGSGEQGARSREHGAGSRERGAGKSTQYTVRSRRTEHRVLPAPRSVLPAPRSLLFTPSSAPARGRAACGRRADAA